MYWNTLLLVSNYYLELYQSKPSFTEGLVVSEDGCKFYYWESFFYVNVFEDKGSSLPLVKVIDDNLKSIVIISMPGRNTIAVKKLEELQTSIIG